jgi:single-strand DNA-binding protein
MKDLNKILLIGRLGGDPIRRETKSGTAVTQFSVATSRKILKEDDSSSGASEIEETVWHTIVVWGRQAEACAQYLTKGQSVYVEGAVRKRSYVSKDGASRLSFEVHAESVGFLGTRKREGESPTELEAVGA